MWWRQWQCRNSFRETAVPSREQWLVSEEPLDGTTGFGGPSAK